MSGIIYALAEPNSHNIRYCGKTVQALPDRLRMHRSDVERQSHRHLYRWLRKVYNAGQEPEVIVCEELDLSDLSRNEQLAALNEAETRWILQFKALGFRLTNATNGGDGCHGRVVSAETRAKTSQSNIGQKRSPEACLNIKEAANKRPMSCYVRGESHPQFGKTQSWKDPEARAQNIRDAWTDDKRAIHGVTISGEKNGKSKINSTIAMAIYNDTRNYREIGATHSVNFKMISDIKNGTTWRHVTGHDPLNKRVRCKIDGTIAAEIFLSNDKYRDIASKYNVSETLISNIKNGKRWSHITSLLHYSKEI